MFGHLYNWIMWHLIRDTVSLLETNGNKALQNSLHLKPASVPHDITAEQSWLVPTWTIIFKAHLKSATWPCAASPPSPSASLPSYTLSSKPPAALNASVCVCWDYREEVGSRQPTSGSGLANVQVRAVQVIDHDSHCRRLGFFGGGYNDIAGPPSLSTTYISSPRSFCIAGFCLSFPTDTQRGSN